MPAVLTLVDSRLGAGRGVGRARWHQPFVTPSSLGWKPPAACPATAGHCATRCCDGPRLIAAAPAWRRTTRAASMCSTSPGRGLRGSRHRVLPQVAGRVPWSPVPGRDSWRATSRRGRRWRRPSHNRAAGWSSLHVNFLPESKLRVRPALAGPPELQFHWETGWRDFADYLAAMTSRRRKAIRQADEGRTGGLSLPHRTRRRGQRRRSAAMHDFYRITFAQKGNVAVLTRGFFAHLARTMPRAGAGRGAHRRRRCACAAATPHGRYWGSVEDSPPHFETCYYQGHRIPPARGIAPLRAGRAGRTQAGARLSPVLTHSRHPRTNLRPDALRPWCAQEREGVRRYRDLLLEHSPFRHAPAAS